MDVIFDLLPFLIFILAVISKTKKKTESSHGRSRDPGHRPQGRKVPVYPAMKIDDFKRIGGRIGETLKREIYTTLEEVLGDDWQNRGEELKEDKGKIIEQYNEKPEKSVIENISTTETKEENKGKDVIKETEIGKNQLSINKESVLHGIIMAEVLGKPKAVKR
ncbi:hypothetical protein [Thermotalea metallivorans]|uniref:Uncharacterized protein n=1 Tax=Thermotalea metallivorans TaxID=520762 RepID=A0A140L5P7_9FIRM|nr:hypothetical protein [Thermotalea metallivorans]KXG75872.1 hypothetical protein AN619_13350 [Thermotalea metallivorans]